MLFRSTSVDKDGKPNQGGVMFGNTFKLNVGGCLGMPDNSRFNDFNIYIDNWIFIPLRGKPEEQINIGIGGSFGPK